MVVILILLLLAAIFGVLGAVLKAALVIVLAIVLAFAILVGGTFWYVRHRLTRLMQSMDRQQRGYPTTGRKRPGPGLPPE